VGARREWREAQQGAVTSRAGRGCCGSRWYTRRWPLQTRSSCSLVGRAPLCQPAASHADRTHIVGGGFFCSRRLPPRGSNMLRCSRAGSCSTPRFPSVCCFQRTRRWESTKAAPLPCKSPPFQEQRSKPKSAFHAPCGAMGAGQRSARANHCARGWGGCPAPLQSMAHTSPNKGLCAPICTAAATIK